jgi:8-oxo-dGTP diphosphatase
MKTKYVAGFMFRNSPNVSDERQVALVLKDHPKWQAGKLNAIGGKISGDETPTYAMVREFAEETGSETKPEDWREFCVLGDHGRGAKHWQVHFFVCLEGNGKMLRTAEKEEIAWHSVCHLLLNQQSPIIPNLRWLIPLALDKDQVFGTVGDISNF